MYAETHSRGGVLEPEGIVEIKFRRARMNAVMERLDPVYKSLKQELDAAIAIASSVNTMHPAVPSASSQSSSSSSSLPQNATSLLKAKLATRERELAPSYHAAAIQFADAHDSPRRMLSKGVINEIVGWKSARKYCKVV